MTEATILPEGNKEVVDAAKLINLCDMMTDIRLEAFKNVILGVVVHLEDPFDISESADHILTILDDLSEFLSEEAADRIFVFDQLENARVMLMDSLDIHCFEIAVILKNIVSYL